MANQYKITALESLKGNWKTAMCTGFVASLFGATTIYGSSSSAGASGMSGLEETITKDIEAFFYSPQGDSFLLPILAFIGVSLLLVIVSIFIAGAMRMGYARFNLNLIDHKTASFKDLFCHMNRKWKGFCMEFMTGLYIILWSLLLLIPGTIKTFSYAMTPFILSENPDLTVNEAITASRKLMDGNKWKLFCMYLSFLGWSILTLIPAMVILGWAGFCYIQGTMAIGPVLVWTVAGLLVSMLCTIPFTAYIEAANAAFYRSLKSA